jgi:hypothetical protein
VASKIKVDTLETADGTGSIALSNQLSGMTTASLPPEATDAASLTGALPAISGANLTNLPAVEDNTPSFMAERTSSYQSMSNGTNNKVQFQTQVFSTGGTYSTSNYRWTPSEAGKYYIYASVRYQGGNNQWRNGTMELYKNGIDYMTLSHINTLSSYTDTHTHHGGIIVEATATDYFEIYTYVDITTGGTSYVRNDGSLFMGFKVAGA